jgi:hypothetical protein
MRFVVGDDADEERFSLVVHVVHHQFLTPVVVFPVKQFVVIVLASVLLTVVRTVNDALQHPSAAVPFSPLLFLVRVVVESFRIS